MSEPSPGFTDGNDYVSVSNVGSGIHAGDGNDIVVILDQSYSQFVNGDGGDDTIFGSAGENRIRGGDGDDSLDGNHIEDVLVGDRGNDYIRGFGGDDELSGGGLSDRFTGPANHGFNTDYGFVSSANVWTPSGDDTLFGNAGADTIYGFDGADEIFGGEDNDRIFGGADADHLHGEFGDDLLYGGHGDDILYGGVTVSDDLRSDGEDRLEGGDGNDTLIAGGGVDSLFGGDGNDVLITGPNEDYFDGGMGDDTIFVDNIDWFFTTAEFPDTPFKGGAGADTITFELTSIGLTFNLTSSRLFGFATDFEHFVGSQGDDIITLGELSVNGFGGNDRFVSTDREQNIDGGAGRDLVTYRNSSDGVVIALDAASMGWTANGRGGLADRDILANIEEIIATDHADLLIGDAADNTFRGMQQNDTLKGGEGGDALFGNQGDDLLEGGAHADTLDGGAGTDTATYRDSKYGVFVQLDFNNGGYGLRGDAGFDKLISIENLTGSYQDDHLRGDHRDNLLEGSFGADTLVGGDGDDTLVGAQGDDKLEGGDGADAFVFYADHHTGDDIITDFEAGVDRIEIYGDAEVEVIEGENGVEILIQGKSQGVLTVDSVWDVDLMLMG